MASTLAAKLQAINAAANTAASLRALPEVERPLEVDTSQRLAISGHRRVAAALLQSFDARLLQSFDARLLPCRLQSDDDRITS